MRGLPETGAASCVLSRLFSVCRKTPYGHLSQEFKRQVLFVVDDDASFACSEFLQLCCKMRDGLVSGIDADMMLE